MLDLVPFIVKIIEVSLAGPAKGSVYSRFYMIQTARVPWKQLSTELAKVLYKKGIVKSPEAKAVDFEHAGEGEVKHLVAGNMLYEGNRAASMGFKATHPSILVELHKDLADATF